jgi:hypothetical protein
MHAPSFRYELNLNTLLLGITLVVTGVGWGIGYNALVTGRDANAAAIRGLETRVATIETTGRLLDNHELRITRVEGQAVEAATAMRAVEQSLGSLTSDMRLVREILERVERGQNGSRSQPRQ